MTQENRHWIEDFKKKFPILNAQDHDALPYVIEHIENLLAKYGADIQGREAKNNEIEADLSFAKERDKPVIQAAIESGYNHHIKYSKQRSSESWGINLD